MKIQAKIRPYLQRPFFIVTSFLLGALLTASLLFAAGNEANNSQPSALWTTVLTENFESGLGSSWEVTDTNGITNGQYYWAATSVTASQGLTSVWATGGGLSGSLLIPLSDTYPNNAASFMVYGPINLSNTTAVSLTYDYWLETQLLSDTFQTLLSTNGVTYTTEAAFSGPSPGWQSLALNLDSYANETQIWLAFNFESDDSTTARGVFLDNITLQAKFLPIPSTVYLAAVFSPSVKLPPPDLPEWLQYFNLFRQKSNVPQLDENEFWSDGDWLHSRYMVKNDYAGHSEDPNNPWYSPEGLAAGQTGNVFVSSWLNALDLTALDFWLAAPFHSVSMMDPRLATTAFGSYREADGGYQMGATLDVARGRTNSATGYPIFFPGNGSQTWIRQYYGGEFPDPLSPCPGYAPPTGPGLVMQLGSGGITPNVTGASLTSNGSPVQICFYDETNYVNSNQTVQTQGRVILNGRDAVFIIPRNPLTVGQTYTATIYANGQTYSWTFTVISPPGQQAIIPDDAVFAVK